MLNNVIISILCPIYNEEKYIVTCIESIINQDVDKILIEVLFIDGGSTDDTVSIIEDFKKKYSFSNSYSW